MMEVRYHDNFTFLAAYFAADGSWAGPAWSGLDIETEGVLSPHDGAVATVQISVGDTVHVAHWAAYYRLCDVLGVLRLRDYLASPGVVKVIHNAAFELKFLLAELGTGTSVASLIDTQAAEYLLAQGESVGLRGLGLGDSVKRRFGEDLDKDHDLRTGFRRRGAKKALLFDPLWERHAHVFQRLHRVVNGKKALKAVCEGRPVEDPEMATVMELLGVEQRGNQGDLDERQLTYAANDAYWAARLGKEQLREVDALAARDALVLDTDMAEVVARMELTGMPIDRPALETMDAEFAYELACLSSELETALGTTDLLSSDKMPAVLGSAGFDVPSYEKGELKRYASDPLIQSLLRYKQLHKLKSTYTEGLLKRIHPKTGRVHAQFNQFTTATGRFSASQPNMQNLPSKGPFAKKIRGAFKAPDGRVIVKADYSNIEMRLIAEIYNDAAMIRAFQSGQDVHTRMAASVLGCSYEELARRVAEEEPEAIAARSAAKPANFGLGYGAGPARLQEIAWDQYDLDWTLDYATQMHAAYHATWPAVGEYHRRISQQIKDGCREEPFTVYSLDGRPRRMQRYFFSKKHNKTVSCFAAAVNHPIQGTAGDMIKRAMVALIRELPPEAHLILVVHDELLVECPEEMAPYVSMVLKGTMEEAGARYLKRVPCIAEVKVAQCWTK